MPAHHSYLEPYFGSGAILFNKPCSPIETVNDIDGDVTNLFACIRDYAHELAFLVARQEYDNAFKYCRSAYWHENWKRKGVLVVWRF